MLEEFVWSQKYRPKTIDETIMPERLKDLFRGFIAKGDLPNLLLKGKSGVGKTTTLLAATHELGANVMFKNGSLNTNLDTLRNDITNFASSMSFTGGRKYVILDEADGLQRLTQPALRSFMEEYSANCGFLFTANMPANIITPLRSRLTEVDFSIRKDETRDILIQMYKRLVFILETENVKFEKFAVRELMLRYAPDWRKCIDELQRYSTERGEIDSGILVSLSEQSIKELFEHIKSKSFGDLRKWVAENSEMEPHLIFRAVFDTMHTKLNVESAAYIVTVIADYQYKSAMVADQEINTLACLTQIMAEAEFK